MPKEPVPTTRSAMYEIIWGRQKSSYWMQNILQPAY